MAEKRIPITYRARREDKKKRISLSPSDGVSEVEEKSKELFKLHGRVCLLKAKIGSDEYTIEANSQEDIDVLRDAEELIIQPKENDKLVCIDEEGFDLDKLPLYTSKLVRRDCQKLAIPSMVAELNKVKHFLNAAYHGTRNFKEINMEVQQVVYTLEKFCGSSSQSMESFHSDCRLILEILQGAIRYLFGGQDDMAALNFKTTADISTKMIAKSSELQEMLEEGIEKVRGAIGRTKNKRSEKEKELEDVNKRTEQKKHDSAILANEVAQAEDLIGTLEHQAEETKHQIAAEDVWKLEEDKKEQKERRHKKKVKLTELTNELESQKEKKDQLVQNMKALHWAISGLNGLSNITIKTKQIFGTLSNELDCLASRSNALKEKVSLTSAKQGGSLRFQTLTFGFKIEAVTCLSKWVALEHVLSSRKIQMKETTDDVQKFLCENPTKEEADRKMEKIWKWLEEQLQLTRAEDDQQKESLPACDLSEDALADIKGGTQPANNSADVGPEEGSPSTGPLQAAKDVTKGEGAPPCGMMPMAYSNVVKQRVPKEKDIMDIKDTQQGWGHGNTTESNSSQDMQAAGTISYEVSRRNLAHLKNAEANLYVNNLAANIDDDYLRGLFSRFGEVTSVRVMRDDEGHSRGFGFVCLSSPEEADKAIHEMNGEVIDGNRLVVEHKQTEGTSIFVNNLDKRIDEKRLEREFRQFGNITGVTVWKDKNRKSQGFGLVCYNSKEEAVQAITHMDGKTIESKSVVVDFAQNKEGRNIYINNLADNIDDNYLRHIFEEFGTITSAKVMIDMYGNSKGYGFVCFRTSDQAAEAIAMMNGQIIEDRQLYVDLHVPRWKEGNRNIYVNNLADNIDDDHLYQAFKPFGTITSAKVMVDLDGFSKGFGFVCFSSPHEARLAIGEMNGNVIEGKQLYVDVAQSRAGKNVYVNNLARHIDDDQLHEAFASFGTITSAKVNTDHEGNSLGFGFVCYSSPQEAEAAINEMNGSTLENMVLYVALAQPPQRRDYLK